MQPRCSFAASFHPRWPFASAAKVPLRSPAKHQSAPSQQAHSQSAPSQPTQPHHKKQQKKSKKILKMQSATASARGSLLQDMYKCCVKQTAPHSQTFLCHNGLQPCALSTKQKGTSENCPVLSSINSAHPSISSPNRSSCSSD